MQQLKITEDEIDALRKEESNMRNELDTIRKDNSGMLGKLEDFKKNQAKLKKSMDEKLVATPVAAGPPQHDRHETKEILTVD